MRAVNKGDEVWVMAGPVVVEKMTIERTTNKFVFTNTGLKFKREFPCGGYLRPSNPKDDDGLRYKVLLSKQYYIDLILNHDFSKEEMNRVINITNYLKNKKT